MLHKLQFRILSATSQDFNHKAIELVNHSPGSKGWYSSNFCIYPQEIVLELENRSHIKKVQLLSHQYMIATKVEFFIGDCPSNEDISVHNSRFSRLGYVALSDNEKTQFKARELKSVHVDAIGRYIKILIHKNYINKHNHYNQVGIIALNVIGDEISSKYDEIENISNSLNSDFISPTEDLAFDMRVDPETANIIRKLEKEKLKAVENEQFDKAQKIKDKIVYLIELGDMIGKLEIEKKNAVEKQNYERAQLKKQQIEQYRQNTYKELDLIEFMFEDNIKFDRRKKPNYEEELTKRAIPIPLNQNNNALGSYERSQQHYSPINNEDRPLPALVNKKQDLSPKVQDYPSYSPPLPAPPVQDLSKDGDDNVNLNNDENVIPGMSKADISEASDAIEVYGLSLVSKMYSKNWSHREDALLEIKKRLEDLPNDTDRDAVKAEIKAASCVLRKAFKTRMTQIIQLALSIDELILVELTNRLSIAKPEIHSYLDRTNLEIFKCIEDMKVQIRDLAYQHLIDMSQYESVKHLPHIYQESIKPFNNNALVKDAIKKLQLLLDLYSVHGLCNHYYSLDNFMKFAASALQHKSAEVRENAEALIVVLYRNEDKSIVRSYLPPDDMKTRKNILYKRLFEKLDKIDGIDPNFVRQPPPPPLTQFTEPPQKQDKPNTGRIMKKSNPSPRQPPASSRNTDIDTKSKPNNESALSTGDPANLAPYDETVCIFCGERNEDFVNNIDMHYWKFCPILRRCPHCKQAVEISLLTQHLLQECDQSSQFSECPRCTEAILKSEYDQHVSDQLCNPSDSVNSLRCPLCHENLPIVGQYKDSPETLWQFHLMDEKNGCQQNPRRLVTLQRQRQQNENSRGGSIKNGSNKKHSQLPKSKAK